MEWLPEVEGEVVSKGKSITKALVANTRLRVWLTVAVVIIILGIIAIIGTYSSISTKIEAKLRDEFDKQIVSLQNEVEDTKGKYEDKLEKQKESYEKQISTVDEKHKKEIERKDSRISELEEKLREAEVKLKISIDEIESDIKSVGKLTTVDYHYTYAGTYEDAKKFFNTDWEMGITRKSFIAQWDGVVAIGVDLAKAKINVNEEEQVITMTLPDAEMFYHDVDEESFEIYDEKNNIFNPITVIDKVKFDQKYEDKVFVKIKEGNMLEKAKEGAEMTIRNILNGIPQIKSQYEIVFQ